MAMTMGSMTVTGTTAPPSMASPVGEAIVSFWKGAQRQNGGAKILAPIRGALQRLSVASKMIEGSPDQPQLSEALQLVRVSSMNCYIYEADDTDSTETRASLLTQQLKFADPCTFRLIVKNVTDLSPPSEAQEGKQLVQNIIQSYSLLDVYLEDAIQGGGSSALPRVQEQLASTQSQVAALESFVVKVLGV